jgi:hypothetical protein
MWSLTRDHFESLEFENFEILNLTKIWGVNINIHKPHENKFITSILNLSDQFIWLSSNSKSWFKFN